MTPLVGALVGAAVMVVALLSVTRAYGANRRQRALPVAAARAGLQFSDVDRFNSAAVAFPLFREGDERLVRNVMWRTADEPEPSLVARVFDFSFRDTRGSMAAATSTVWHDFTCALAQHNGQWPVIRVSRENVVQRVLEPLGLPDIDFESEEFNRTFVVQCSDRRFASALIDPQMMTFMLATAGAMTFETKGRFLLVTTAPLEADAVPGLLHVAEEFLRLVPPAVRELYPSFPEGAGTDVFPLPPMVTPAPASDWSDLFGGPLGPRELPSPFEFTDGPNLVDPGPDPWDPTPGVDHDLEGRPVTPATEDPWHDRPPSAP